MKEFKITYKTEEGQEISYTFHGDSSTAAYNNMTSQSDFFETVSIKLIDEGEKKSS